MKDSTFQDFLEFFNNFCPIETDQSGNTVFTISFRFSKTHQIGPFFAFLMNFFLQFLESLGNYVRNTFKCSNSGRCKTIAFWLLQRPLRPSLSV